MSSLSYTSTKTTGENSIVSSKSNPIRERFTTMLNRISIRRLAIPILMIVLGGLYGVSFASASADSNNVCLNGVATKAKFLECYNTNASARALYNSLGITEEGINEAKKDKTCADGKTMSYGRNFTPGSATVNPDGNKFYKRLLASVMKGCADSWRVHTKNGDVWVLWFCGNPETKSCSCHKHSSAKKHSSKKYKLYLSKLAQGGTYPGQAIFKVTIGSAKAKTVKVTPNASAKSLGSCNKNSKAKVTEINVAAGWSVKGNKTQTYTCKRSKTFTFTNVKNEKKEGCDSTNTNSGNVSGVVFVQGSCNDVHVTCETGACNPSTTNICPSAASGGSASNGSTGGNATSTANCLPPTCEDTHTCPPPTCEQTHTCPPPATAQCTALKVDPDLQHNLGVNASVAYTASGGASLTSVTFYWDNNDLSNKTTITGGGVSASKIYTSAGSRTVNATLKFSTPQGDISSNCTARTVTPKNGTSGDGSGGGGGTGSGGSPGDPTSGETCTNDSGHLVYGPHDQFGYCPSGYVGNPVTA